MKQRSLQAVINKLTVTGMRLSFFIISGVLVAAITLTILSSRMEGAKQTDKERIDLLAPIMGSHSVPKELGPSESLSEHAVDILGMSWYDCRELKINGRQFSVYVAFWRPKTVNFFEVSQHVPDQCWVGNGMSLVKKASFGTSLGGTALPGVNARTFSASGTPINTWFWHAVGSDFVNYNEYGSNRTTGFLAANLTFFFKSKPQVFLRIDSMDSWENLTADPKSRGILMQVIQEVLAKAGNHTYGSS